VQRDSQQRTTTLEIVERDDLTFDIFLNGKLDRRSIAERWLPGELCVRFGFCGDEYDVILREVKQKGRAEVRFWRLVSVIADFASQILTG
jgi:hypothetical protein